MAVWCVHYISFRDGKVCGGISLCKYLLQRPQCGGERLRRDCSQFLRQPGLVHGANLIEQDQTLPATMNDTDPKRRLATRRRHGCDEYCAQMIVHFGRGTTTHGRVFLISLPTVGS